MDRPASTTRRGSSQSSCRGPSIATAGEDSATESSTSRQVGSGAASSCRTQSHSPALRSPPGGPHRRSASATAAAMAVPNGVSRGRSSTTSTRLEERRRSGVESLEPVSTAITRRGPTVRRPSAPRVSGSQVSPSWQTSTASTGAVAATASVPPAATAGASSPHPRSSSRRRSSRSPGGVRPGTATSVPGERRATPRLEGRHRAAVRGVAGGRGGRIPATTTGRPDDAPRLRLHDAALEPTALPF